MSKLRDFVEWDFVDYVAGGTSLPWATDEAREVFHRGSIEWNNAPCDPDGPSREQDEIMDGIIDDVCQGIIDLGDDAFLQVDGWDYTALIDG